MNSDGVSAILGTILMVGLSVVLFATIIPTVQEPWYVAHSPLVDLTAYQTSTGITITHTGGERVEEWEISVNDVVSLSGTNFTIGDNVRVPLTNVSDVLFIDSKNNCVLLSATIGPLRQKYGYGYR